MSARASPLTTRRGSFSGVVSTTRRPPFNFRGSILSWSRVTRGPGPAPGTCSTGASFTRRAHALSTNDASGPRLTTMLFSTLRLFTIRVFLMITVIRDSGTMKVRTRGARKLPADTKTKGPANDPPKLADKRTENPGETGAQPKYSGPIRKTTHAGAQT